MDIAFDQKRGRPWHMYAMLAITIVPIVAAYLVYYTGWGVPTDKVNEGELLVPAKNVSDLFNGSEGDVWEIGADHQWRLLIPVTASCNEQCQQQLYLTRQVHIRLGDKADRLARVAVVIGHDLETAKKTLQGEHPKLSYLGVSEKQWHDWLAGANVPSSVEQSPYYLLTDQVGFAMMKYDERHDGNQLLKDIKRVLRYSPE